MTAHRARPVVIAGSLLGLALLLLLAPASVSANSYSQNETPLGNGDIGHIWVQATVGTSAINNQYAYVNYVWAETTMIAQYSSASARTSVKIYSGKTLKWQGSAEDWWTVNYIPATVSRKSHNIYTPTAASRVMVSRGGGSRVEVTFDGAIFLLGADGLAAGSKTVSLAIR